jgi:hypothetical protein
MKQILSHWIAQVIYGGTGALVLSAAARSLPDPAPMGSRFYLWFYRFAQTLLANFDKAQR